MHFGESKASAVGFSGLGTALSLRCAATQAKSGSCSPAVSGLLEELQRRSVAFASGIVRRCPSTQVRVQFGTQIGAGLGMELPISPGFAFHGTLTALRKKSPLACYCENTLKAGPDAMLRAPQRRRSGRPIPKKSLDAPHGSGRRRARLCDVFLCRRLFVLFMVLSVPDLDLRSLPAGLGDGRGLSAKEGTSGKGKGKFV